MSATPFLATLPQAALPSDQVWMTLLQMLIDQLPGVDIQPISDKDFNGSGDLIMTPPSVRVFFGGTAYQSSSDSQRLTYEAVGRYVVSCADQNLQSPAQQAVASAALAGQVKGILAGSRILLADGEITEPATLVSEEPLPVTGLGTAYALGFEIPGVATFPGTNAGGYSTPSPTATAQEAT